jgi:Tol biopolymer transport system component
MRWLAFLVLALALCVPPLRAADAPGGQIVYPRKEGDGYQLHMMNADGTGDRVLANQPAGVCVFPAWSPDGKRIAFMNSPGLQANQHQVCLINADGSGLVTLNAPSQRAGLAAWSPDGKQLAFTAGDEAPNVYVSDAGGNGARQVNPAGAGAAGAFWLPDGKTIGYTRLMANEKGPIVLAKVDGGGEEPLTQGDGLAVAGPNALSPDGRKLLYFVLQRETMKGSLRLWEFAAKVENTILDVDLGDGKLMTIPLAAWSPDGKAFLIPMKTEKGTGLFRVSLDSKTRTRLTPEGVDCLAGAWR